MSEFENGTTIDQEDFSNQVIGANESINPTVLQRIQLRVYRLERDNQKSKQFTDKQMREEIQRIIKGEVDKCY